jgi:hypothetical protein
MSLKLNSSGGGSVTVQEPSTASNRTLTLPDATTTAVGTDATQTLSNKTFSGAQTFGTASFAEPSGSAPLFAARAWVNFNGESTVAIRASGNVSSITDNGTGDYTVNLTTAMPDANYSLVSQITWVNSAFGATARATWIVSLATSNARLRTGIMASAPAMTAEDENIICVAIFR